MSGILIRASSIGKLMTEPKTKGEVLSQGAKTAIREMAAEDIFGVKFSAWSKPIQKGLDVESDAIQMLNRVRGLSLTKNTERKSNGLVTGECDMFDTGRKVGHDIKCSWSVQTFPICEEDCADKLYEWQMRAYMWLWDADKWEVNYCLISTPENLIGFEPRELHEVDHVPEFMRITTWEVTRDYELEDKMAGKVRAARAYYAEVIEEFDRTHKAIECALS